MSLSPTQLTLKRLRDQGYLAAVVEKWNHGAKIRQDLFGFIDVIGVSEQGTIAIQATSDSNLSARVKKMVDHENIAKVREAGWQIEAWGWKKVKNRWQVRIIDVS